MNIARPVSAQTACFPTRREPTRQSTEAHVPNIDRDEHPTEIRAHVGIATIGQAARRQDNPVRCHMVIHILRRSESACDIQVIVMSTYQPVLTEIEVLYIAVTLDIGGKSDP